MVGDRDEDLTSTQKVKSDGPELPLRLRLSLPTEKVLGQPRLCKKYSLERTTKIATAVAAAAAARTNPLKYLDNTEEQKLA